MDIQSKGNRVAQPRILEGKFAYLEKSQTFIYAVIGAWIFAIFLVLKAVDFKTFNLEGFASLYIAFFISISLTLYYLFHILAHEKKRIQVFKDKLIITGLKKEVIYLYEDILEITPVKTWYNYSFKLVLKKNRVVHIKNISRLDYILDSILMFNPKIMNFEEYAELRENIVCLDHSNSRFDDIFFKKRFQSWRWFFIVTPFVFSLLCYLKQHSEIKVYSYTQYFSDLFLFSFAAQIVLGWILYKVFDRKLENETRYFLKRNFHKKMRNRKTEARMFKQFYSGYQLVLGTLLLFSFILNLNFYSYESLKLNLATEKKFSKTDWYLIDKRYNCVQCNFFLTKGDIVVFDDKQGKVLALGNEFYTYLEKNKDGRTIASDIPKPVPNDSIVVAIDNSENYILVKQNKIKGKLTPASSPFREVLSK